MVPGLTSPSLQYSCSLSILANNSPCESVVDLSRQCGILIQCQSAIILHRINGYIIFLLYALGTAGGVVTTRHAYGGHIETQTAAGALAILVLVASLIAWAQIKRL